MFSESKVVTHSAQETRHIGQRLGKDLQPGTILSIKGELGSGKTVFVQGLAIGLGVPDSVYVTSPSYTLINEYPGRCRLFHADFYRLNNVSDFDDLGFDEIMEGSGVVAIEWPERLPEHFPESDIEVEIKIIGENERKISFSFI
jgi:tRNA threonylcarbamoyladenosine biosynthesis protein TsaE